ncbi:MAG TPA: hypothetical protein PKK32_02210, partial [Candidatus Paceibacterota bacterium]|nr:hypothetical protein [Candidatus Paceibacterota bacterium]
TWAKQILGMKPAVERDVISRIMRMDKILNPENEKSFLRELASKKLGVDITIEEARKITKLSNKIKSLENFTDKAGRIKYGRARMDLVDYVNKLSGKKANLVKNIIGLPRAVLATLDLSAPLNQGWGMLSRKEFYKNLSTMFKALKNEDNFLNIQAEIMTRDTFKRAKKAGLRINDLGENLELREEAFMTTLLDKVPGVSASQRAYTSFLNKLRMDVFDDLLSKAEIAGEDVGLGSKAAEDIATIVNAFTGGYGKTDPLLNALLFSPRRVRSAVKILNPWTYINPKTSKTARKAAIRNLLGSLAMTGSVIALAGLHGAVETEEDPRSSDFGKIKVGDTRLDISGGIAGYVILLSRILSGEIKSSNTGAIKKLGNNYGSTSGFDLTAELKVTLNFIRNKLSPLASLIIDVLTGENAVGEKKTPTQSVIDRFKPMFLKDAYEVLTEDPEAKILIPFALFGGGLSTYSISEDWTTKDTKEMAQFKQKVGEKEFKAANEKYNQIIRKEIEALKKTDKYKKMTPDEQLKEITKIKDKAKKDIFKQYNFQYKKSLPSKK